MNEKAEQLTLPGTEPTGTDTLHTIIKLAGRLAELEAELKTREEDLKKLKDEIEQVSTKSLPDLMQSLGLTEIRITDGRKIRMSTEYYASIPKIRMAAAAEWLRERNMGGIVKEKILVNPDYKERLVENMVPYTIDESIHPSTLRAFVREQVEAGKDLPHDLFGVHVVNQAVVKND